MTKGDIHTTHRNESGWVNVREGEDGTLSVHETKDAALTAGREAARTAGVEHHEHNLDGTIAGRSSYGNDPADRPG